MARRILFCVPLVLLLAALVAGCKTGAGTSKASQSESFSPVVAAEAITSLSEEKAARAHAHYAAAVIHDMNAETEAALEEYRLSALDDPENEELVLEVSRRFIQSKQPEKALEVLSLAARQPGASGAIFARLGLVYVQLNRLDEAAKANRMAISKSPSSLAGYQNLFLNYLQEKKVQEAWAVLEEASRRPDSEADFLVGLSELYANFGIQVPSQKEKSSASARALLERAEKLDSISPLLRSRIADGFNSLGDSAKAAAIYLELLKTLPDQPGMRERLHAKLASIYLRDSDGKRAVEHLEAMLREDPTNPQAYYYLGRLQYDQKKAAEAAEQFRKAILLSPDFKEAWFYLALSQLAANKTSDALATLDKARDKFPQSYDLELWTGLAYSQQKGYREAIRHFTAAEVIAKTSDPSLLTHEFYFQIGAAYERSGDLAEAEKCFEKSLQLKPDFAAALNYLGYMWAEKGMKLERARELIERAVKTDPKNAAYLDSLGWVLFKLNQAQEGLDLVLKAVELNPEPDATLYDHLGDIYAALNQPDKAREAWTKSLSVEPSDQVKKKLDGGGAR